MRTKRVNRYYCDFCRKSGCSAPHMAKHERHCTMNPNRECGVCKMLNLRQQPMAVLLALQPNPADYPATDEFGAIPRELSEAAEASLQELRDATDDCPACILAALRQGRICIPAIGYDFRREMDAAFERFNERREAEG